MEIDKDITGRTARTWWTRSWTLRQQVAVLREQIGRLQVEREEMKRTYDKALERANRRVAELEEK